jgi:beta-phosphoglucomutase
MVFNGKKLLIFDYDGTIADSNKIHEAAFYESLESMQLDFDYAKLAGLSTEDAFKTIFVKNNVDYSEIDLDSLVHQKRLTAMQLIQKNLQPLPGCLEFLEEARKHFTLTVVSSGSSESIIYGLRKFKILSLFKLIICRDHVDCTKPNPEGLLKAFSNFSGLKKSEVLVLEDSENGFAAAQNANFEFIDIKKIDWIMLLKMLARKND